MKPFRVIGGVEKALYAPILFKDNSIGRFWVNVVDKKGTPAFRDANLHLRWQANKWCHENCSYKFEISEFQMVIFENEEDAILFMVAFG